MKNLFFLIVFTTISSFGQQKVYSFKDFDLKVMGLKQTHETYPVLGVFKLDEKKVETKNYDAYKQLIYHDFLKFARNKGIRFTDFEYRPMLFFPISILVQSNGVADYLVYGLKPETIKINNKPKKLDSLSADETKIFTEIAESFCKEYKFPQFQNATNYNVSLNMTFGKTPRKVSSRGITTIEVAEKTTRPDTVKSLIFNKLYLEKFPEFIFRFKNLEGLDLSDNMIEQVPRRVLKLKKLSFLNLSGNFVDYSKFRFERNKHLKYLSLQFTGMTKIPKSLRRNRRLEILFLGNNSLVFSDKDFKRMNYLRTLNLYNVQATKLSKSIGKLQNLEELDLYYNNFRFLPDEICQLKNLKTLAVAHNQLWNLPDELAQMPNLQVIYAHHNRLDSLPTLPNLKLLDIGYNLFKVFPEQVYGLKNLEEIDITNNEITDTPEKLSALQNLQRVFMRGNGFSDKEQKNAALEKLTADLELRKVIVR